MDDQRDLLMELFDDLKVTHEYLSRSCSTLFRLSRTLNLAQLMRALKASTRPLIQVNMLEGFFDKLLTTTRKIDLPDNINTRVRLMMTSNPKTDDMVKEKANSPTHLLAAIFTCKILRRFTDGTTQQDIQEKFKVRPKQLSTCITGRKYLGGMDRRSLTRKCKLFREDSGQSSSSKKPSTE